MAAVVQKDGTVKVNSFSNAAKFYVGLAVALVATFGTLAQTKLDVSNVAQVVIVLLTVVAGYAAPYSPKWWASAKMYAVTLGAMLSAVVPLLVEHDASGWHNLTKAEWIVFALAVVKAVAMVVTSNTEPLEYREPDTNGVVTVTDLPMPNPAFTPVGLDNDPFDGRHAAKEQSSDASITGGQGTGTVV